MDLLFVVLTLNLAKRTATWDLRRDPTVIDTMAAWILSLRVYRGFSHATRIKSDGWAGTYLLAKETGVTL
jgi:hypothetical protein